MDKEDKTILLNQLRIMSAMQRLEFFVHQQEIEEDLSEGIKDTQKILNNDIDNKISMQEENTNLKQALNEIRDKFELKIKENQDLIEKLADTGSFRIGNAQSKIKDYKEFLKVIDKVLGDNK